MDAASEDDVTDAKNKKATEKKGAQGANGCGCGCSCCGPECGPGTGCGCGCGC